MPAFCMAIICGSFKYKFIRIYLKNKASSKRCLTKIEIVKMVMMMMIMNIIIRINCILDFLNCISLFPIGDVTHHHRTRNAPNSIWVCFSMITIDATQSDNNRRHTKCNLECFYCSDCETWNRPFARPFVF